MIAVQVDAAREQVRIAAERAHRDPSSIAVIAVTKTVAAERVQEAVAAGITDIGENRVQEALDKQTMLTNLDVRWHLIGHLQGNKAGRAARAFDVIHTISSEHIASALGARRGSDLPALPVLIEVDFTMGASRTGALVEDAPKVVASVLAQPLLTLQGLMTVAPQAGDDERRKVFRQLALLRAEFEQRHGIPLPVLSMGMSDDFALAVEEGATHVRLGRFIFGTRPPAI